MTTRLSDIFAAPVNRVRRHVSNLPRLFRILSIIAKFRLYEFAEGQSGYLLLRLLLLPFLTTSVFPKHPRGQERCACALP